ncbi:MAG: DUF1015 domain-containing protein [Ruminococcus sp.]|jgi:uncharacterized protein (DUF1015 family)|nr:DUF1015 domain-containing protein [Ruminococcus sp.]
MAKLKPFRGMRFVTKNAGDINELVCPPYDIISKAQREDYIKKNPYNIIRLELPNIDDGDNRYKAAGETLREWLDKQILTLDEQAAFYVYEMEFTANGRRNSLKGFISLVELREFADGVVLPHEETLSKAKTDRFNLMTETMCNFSQIYSLYFDEDGGVSGIINVLGNNPDAVITDPDGTIHRITAVTDTDIIEKLTTMFNEKKLYIADGHHRYETALNFQKKLLADGKATENSGYIEMFLVNIENDGLVIFPTHRIVRGLENFDADKVIKASENLFEITDAANQDAMTAALHMDYDRGEETFAMYTGGGNCKIFRLKDKAAVKKVLPEMSDAYTGLDVSVLHTLVLEGILGIDKENMANQKNLTYTRDVIEALEAVDNNEANCAFILNPTKVKEISDVAAANEKMPQKSTYFYPKLITGLVMNNFS